MASLQGRTAIITGASSGIGAAAAEALSRAGVRLVLTGRRARPAVEVPNSIYIRGDVTEPGLVESLFAKAPECDIVVNNAGILVAGEVDDIDLNAVAHMVRVNVDAAYRVAYLAARHFKEIRKGHLVNISSVLGTKVRLTAGAYSGTKHAIEALSEALRQELAGTRVKVTCVEPGLVMTELHRDFAVHPREQFEIRQALEPEDVARAIVFALEQPDHVNVARLMLLAADQAI
ncbi:MAG TPA: SDR family NAD(P)-dependent oxidoreductase [Terriglobales bacterium]|nr:SDR family NAD(P)-dependent oxidoreductase [Terriglobales bacterium]